MRVLRHALPEFARCADSKQRFDLILCGLKTFALRSGSQRSQRLTR